MDKTKDLSTIYAVLNSDNPSIAISKAFTSILKDTPVSIKSKTGKLIESVMNVNDGDVGESLRYLDKMQENKSKYKEFIKKDLGDSIMEIDLDYNPNKRKVKTYNIDGKEMKISEISKKYGVKDSTIRQRLKRGWSIEESIKKP